MHQDNQNRKSMREQHIPVGIYDTEIFIIRLVDGKPYCGIDNKPIFDVIRPVEDSDLDYLRNQDKRADEYKDFWKQAVAAGDTEESFQDWYDSLWEEEFDEDDPEDFPGKDDSDCQYLDEEKRLAAERAAIRYHIVKNGESLSVIARKEGKSLNAVIKLNPGINPDKLSIGQKIRVN